MEVALDTLRGKGGRGPLLWGGEQVISDSDLVMPPFIQFIHPCHGILLIVAGAFSPSFHRTHWCDSDASRLQVPSLPLGCLYDNCQSCSCVFYL